MKCYWAGLLIAGLTAACSTPQSAPTLEAVSTTSQYANLDDPVVAAPTVRTSIAGKPAARITVTFEGSGIIQPADGIIQTDASGTASLENWSPPNQLGEYTLTANVDGADGVTFVTKRAQVFAANRFTLTSGIHDTIYAWGNGSDHQLGNGSEDNKVSPTEAVKLLPFNNIKRLEVGRGSGGFMLHADGTIKAWGSDAYGQLGIGGTNGLAQAEPRVVQVPDDIQFSAIDSGGLHSLAIDESGELYGWGDNTRGRTGLGKNSVEPEAVGPVDGTAFEHIEAANGHSLALTSEGKVFAWGRGTEGQLGDANKVDRSAPTAVALPAEIIALMKIDAFNAHNLGFT